MWDVGKKLKLFMSFLLPAGCTMLFALLGFSLLTLDTLMSTQLICVS